MSWWVHDSKPGPVGQCLTDSRLGESISTQGCGWLYFGNRLCLRRYRIDFLWGALIRVDGTTTAHRQRSSGDWQSRHGSETRVSGRDAATYRNRSQDHHRDDALWTPDDES